MHAQTVTFLCQISHFGSVSKGEGRAGLPTGHHGGDLLIMKVVIVKVVMMLLMGVTFD